MDVRSIANGVTSSINANVIVTVTPSSGFTTGVGAKQVPTYGTPVTGPAQVQAMTKDELKQLDNMNIQGVALGIYLRGNLYGVVRPDGKGGDLITISAPNPAPWIGTWLVVKVLENWSDWTKVAVTKQGGV